MPPSKLETLTGAALMSMPLPTTRMIVEGLIPQGLHILGGAPKIGKSSPSTPYSVCAIPLVKQMPMPTTTARSTY
ncbi:MAG: AAA family ATPase [Firmicutes bacterium]|nr:AAA family ATPase [Bacillota bacterium]